MFHFAIYERDTGKVLRVGRHAREIGIELERQRLPDGQALFDGEINPDTTFLPGGVPTPKPEEVRVVTAMEIKAHAARLLSYTDWVVIKAFDTGLPADPSTIAKRSAIRAASDALEAMSPIPVDFIDPKYWP